MVDPHCMEATAPAHRRPLIVRADFYRRVQKFAAHDRRTANVPNSLRGENPLGRNSPLRIPIARATTITTTIRGNSNGSFGSERERQTAGRSDGPISTPEIVAVRASLKAF